MVEKILNGITNRLYELFGYKIYTDTVKQGLKPPCFLVEMIMGDTKNYLGSRHESINSYDIKFFSCDSKKTNLYSVGEAMMIEMEWITLIDGTKLHGTKMHYEIVDNVLHFFVNYNLGVKRIADEVTEKMESFDTGGVNVGGNKGK